MRKKLVIIISSTLIMLAGKANIPAENAPKSGHIKTLLQPAEILSFSAVLQNDSVLVQWSCFWETSNKYFEIERSSNGRSWEVIAIVKEENNSNQQQSYTTVDTKPVKGQSYYRLRQIARDGTGKYSRTIAVYYPGVSSPQTIYPKDSGSTFLIKNRTLTNRSMTLFNAIGHRVIFDYNTTDDGTQINLKQMPDGIYTLRINRGIATPSIITLVKQ